MFVEKSRWAQLKKIFLQKEEIHMLHLRDFIHISVSLLPSWEAHILIWIYFLFSSLSLIKLFRGQSVITVGGALALKVANPVSIAGYAQNKTKHKKTLLILSSWDSFLWKKENTFWKTWIVFKADFCFSSRSNFLFTHNSMTPGEIGWQGPFPIQDRSRTTQEQFDDCCIELIRHKVGRRCSWKSCYQF